MRLYTECATALDLLQFVCPFADGPGHFDKDIFAAGSRPLENFEAVIGGVEQVQRRGWAEIFHNRLQQVKLGESVTCAAKKKHWDRDIC